MGYIFYVDAGSQCLWILSVLDGFAQVADFDFDFSTTRGIFNSFSSTPPPSVTPSISLTLIAENNKPCHYVSENKYFCLKIKVMRYDNIYIYVFKTYND